MTLEQAYCKLMDCWNEAQALRAAGWTEIACDCARTIFCIGACCEKCGGRGTYWRAPRRYDDDFMNTL